MADIFVKILPTKNFIVKAVNILTVGIVQLFLKPLWKRSKRDLWRVRYACCKQRDYVIIFAID